MNKRQRKKYEKKLKCKSYYNYRQKRILKIANKYIQNNNIHTDDYKLNMVYIIDSKRGDLKHIHKVQLLLNCTPV